MEANTFINIWKSFRTENFWHIGPCCLIQTHMHWNMHINVANNQRYRRNHAGHWFIFLFIISRPNNWLLVIINTILVFRGWVWWKWGDHWNNMSRTFIVWHVEVLVHGLWDIDFVFLWYTLLKIKGNAHQNNPFLPEQSYDAIVCFNFCRKTPLQFKSKLFA